MEPLQKSAMKPPGGAGVQQKASEVPLPMKEKERILYKERFEGGELNAFFYLSEFIGLFHLAD